MFHLHGRTNKGHHIEMKVVVGGFKGAKYDSEARIAKRKWQTQ
jgi:hypothetical protein